MWCSTPELRRAFAAAQLSELEIVSPSAAFGRIPPNAATVPERPLRNRPVAGTNG